MPPNVCAFNFRSFVIDKNSKNYDVCDQGRIYTSIRPWCTYVLGVTDNSLYLLHTNTT